MTGGGKYIVRVMKFLAAIYFIVDLPLKTWNAVKRYLSDNKGFSSSEKLSDSQSIYYESAVRDILFYKHIFNRFRRIYNYREILEHVSFSLGLRYLERMKEIKPINLYLMEQFKKNDDVGKPRKYYYGEIGYFSPTTLRYISVASEMERIFGKRKFQRVAEIGGGYGGQACVLDKMEFFDEYIMFDLHNVQKLICRYLDLQGVKNVSFPSIEAFELDDIDFVVSNYAFSELPGNLQQQYLEKVLKKARNGYLIMNSGKTNLTGRSSGKLTLKEIQQQIKNIQVIPEIPNTGPDNYVLFWVDDKEY